ncbi:hypothetical protein Ahia01_000287100, partial [Argonauta hians]
LNINSSLGEILLQITTPESMESNGTAKRNESDESINSCSNSWKRSSIDPTVFRRESLSSDDFKNLEMDEMEEMEKEAPEELQAEQDVNPTINVDDRDYCRRNQIFMIMCVAPCLLNLMSSFFQMVKIIFGGPDSRIEYICIALYVNVVACTLLLLYLLYQIGKESLRFTVGAFAMLLSLTLAVLLSAGGIQSLQPNWVVYAVVISSMIFLLTIILMKIPKFVSL